MKRRRLTKADRNTLILLTGLLVAFVLYLVIRPSSNVSEEVQAQSKDTTIISVVNSDTTQQVVDILQAPKEQHTQQPPQAPSTDTLPIRTDKYPGPPERAHYVSKLQPGATVDINSADTLLLQRIPGIGSSFARRIVKYRELLGGYYCVEQIQEVYGMDRKRYDQSSPFMVVKTPVTKLDLTQDTIPWHPYLQWRHRNTIADLRHNVDTLTWSDLMSSGHFTHDDSLRLCSYLPIK